MRKPAPTMVEYWNVAVNMSELRALPSGSWTSTNGSNEARVRDVREEFQGPLSVIVVPTLGWIRSFTPDILGAILEWGPQTGVKVTWTFRSGRTSMRFVRGK